MGHRKLAVTVWCGFCSRGIIGPFFFENEQRKAVTVNGDRYRAMLNEFLFTKIEEEDIGNIWVQQADQPETIDALKDNIRKAIAEIRLHTIDNVLKNWTDRGAKAPIWMKLFSIINRKDCTFK